MLLVLPLAFPAYVLAYAYTDFLSHPGPVQSALRAVTGWGPRDYWFPNVRSLPGAALMLVCVYYPYVYLLARTAFGQQSATAYLAARTLGRGPWAAFVRVSLPMARPAIAAGVLLAVMETIADYGTVAYFNVRTFSTGIYQAWFAMQDRAAAAQLALCLLELRARPRRGRADPARAGAIAHARRPAGRDRAAGARRRPGAGLASVFCLAAGAGGLPAAGGDPREHGGRIGAEPARSALPALRRQLADAGRGRGGGDGDRRDRWSASAPGCGRGARSRALVMAAGLGYAVPGGVIAVGLLVPFAGLDNLIDGWARAHLGISTGLLFTGSIWLLVLAYMARFMAVALNTFDAGLATVSPRIDAVARTLGRRPPRGARAASTCRS